MPCLPLAIDCFVEAALIDFSDLTDESKGILSRLNDSLTQIYITATPQSFIKANENPRKDSDLKTSDVDLGWKKTGDSWGDWKKARVRKIRHSISPNFSTIILGEDDLFSKYSFVEKMTGVAMRSRLLFTLDDSDIYIESDEAASRLLTDLKLNEGQAMPVSYNSSFTMDTDQSFARIFFYGIAAPLIAKQEKVNISSLGPFVADMPLQDLAVRKLYKPYGARVHFDDKQQVTAIYDYVEEKVYTPDDEGWEAAKMHAKVTAFTLCTAREHLVWTHLILSNDTTRESTLNLPPSHPIRRLLTVFTFRATEVNLDAFDQLVPRTCLLHRSSAFKYSSMVKLFDMAYTDSIVYMPFPERNINAALQKLVNQGKFPYVSEGCEYYEIVRTFVRDWLSKAGDQGTDSYATAFYNGMKQSSQGQAYVLPDITAPDAMVNLLSTIIFTVTGYHELIGHLVDYTVLPSRAGFRVAKKDPTKIDLQSFLNATVITASTSRKMPELMSEFLNFFGAGGAPEWEREAWNSFQQALQAQSEKVQKAEKRRPFEFKYFDPSRFECSVSV